MTVIAFFNPVGGVGTTSLVYHLAWMLADLDYDVAAVDLDPQADLTRAFLSPEECDSLWKQVRGSKTVFRVVDPILRGSDPAPVVPHRIRESLDLVPGDIRLIEAEEPLAETWLQTRDSMSERIFRQMWVIREMIGGVADRRFILLDLGPGLTALNRSALMAADHLVVPLGPDLASFQAMQSLGRRLKLWDKGLWQRCVRGFGDDGQFSLGYVLRHFEMRLSPQIEPLDQWFKRMPQGFAQHVLGLKDTVTPPSPADDQNCLAVLRPYRGLAMVAEVARKPIFALTPADGIGLTAGVMAARADYRRLAQRLIDRIQEVEAAVFDDED